MSVLHAIAEVLGTFWFGVRHYANWPTAISCGAVAAVILAGWLVARLTRRTNRSSE